MASTFILAFSSLPEIDKTSYHVPGPNHKLSMMRSVPGNRRRIEKMQTLIKKLDKIHGKSYSMSEQSLSYPIVMRDGSLTKKKIQQTALRLFVEKGITGTTIRDLAAAAGIAEGTLYRHYDSKDQLAWQLFSENFTAFALELDRLQERYPGLRAKLEAMIHQFCAFFDRDPVLFSYLLLAQHEQFKKVTQEMPSPVRVLRSVVETGMAQGEIPAGDPNLATAMVLGLVLQAAVFKVYEGIDQSLSSLAATLCDASWRVLSG
jgi:AcrR family transcriptional regulator